jgi:hypothetical protein
MTKTISISGIHFSAIYGPEGFPFSLTFTGPSKMSDLICPDIATSGPPVPIWGWSERLIVSPDFDFVDIDLGRGVVFEGGAYYVYFAMNILFDEGSEAISDGQNFNITVPLQITDQISVLITFRNPDPFYTFEINSLTCTLREAA